MADKSKFEKTYTLEQQTPLIHFQYDEPGATLRATEVKPKLDEFIIQQNKGKDELRKSHPDWFINNKSDALNYKMHIMIDGSAQTVSLDKNGVYLGNMGKKDESEKTMGTMADSNIKVRIVCFSQNLCGEISNRINDFFLSYNFGSRQNKGFGSFVVTKVDKDGNPIESTQSDIVNAFGNRFGADHCFCIQNVETDKCFDIIKHFYGLLKSGYNPNYAKVDKGPSGNETIYHGSRGNPNYRKSMLVEYFSEKEIGGEKAYLKREGVAPAFSHGTPTDYNKYHYIRVLLGYSSSYAFLSDNLTKIHTNKRSGRRVIGKEIVTVSNMIGESVNDRFRFQSPIFFKIINNKNENGYKNRYSTIYISGTRICDKLFDQEFQFTNEDRSAKVKMIPPSKNVENVDVDENFIFRFLDFAYERLGVDHSFKVPFTVTDGRRSIEYKEYKLEKLEVEGAVDE